MINNEILERAVRKAIKGGWTAAADKVIETIELTSGIVYGRGFVSGIIFNHDFAKALWGEKQYRVKYIRNEVIGAVVSDVWDDQYFGWKHHLQQMVVADDPIKYLGEHLDD